MRWIKLDCSTLDKPEIRQMARMLGLKHGEALELVLRFWIWLDGNSVDGHVDGLVTQDVDDMMRCNGFSGAMQAVGWLKCNDCTARLEVPNFDDHNGESAKKRALTNRRQAKWRDSVDAPVDAPVDADSVTREEKRRTNTNTPPLAVVPTAVKPEPKLSRCPKDFALSERVLRWAMENNHTDLDAHFATFMSYVRKKAPRYADWDEALMGCIRDNWAKVAPKAKSGLSL